MGYCYYSANYLNKFCHKKQREIPGGCYSHGERQNRPQDDIRYNKGDKQGVQLMAADPVIAAFHSVFPV